jgi:hypothetical protein
MTCCDLCARFRALGGPVTGRRCALALRGVASLAADHRISQLRCFFWGDAGCFCCRKPLFFPFASGNLLHSYMEAMAHLARWFIAFMMLYLFKHGDLRYSYVLWPEGNILSGWWFGTWILCSIIYGIIIPTPLTNLYFSRWLKPPTSSIFR